MPNIETHDKELFKIINVTNNSSIFFSSKVILVEGETDEYFFRSLFERLLEEKFSKYKPESIEFLKIGGKGNFKSWREFLNKFKVKNYFIGDLDNIKELQIGSAEIGFARMYSASGTSAFSR